MRWLWLLLLIAVSFPWPFAALTRDYWDNWWEWIPVAFGALAVVMAYLVGVK